MNVLLTSGGGYNCSGLVAMRQALIATGFNVLTVAPSKSCEAAARSYSYGRRLSVKRVGGDERNPIFSVDGFPVDCVRIAILSGLARDVSVVVSGIGRGACLGDDATCSSSMGAAIEAALLGYPSMSISQQCRDGWLGYDDTSVCDFDWACVVGCELTAWLGACPPPDRSVLNVNVPSRLRSRSLKLTSFDHRIWDPVDFGRFEVDPIQENVTIFTPSSSGSQFLIGQGTDAQAIVNGHVSITPFNLESKQGNNLKEMSKWVTKAVNEIDPRIGASSKRCEAGCCG